MKRYTNLLLIALLISIPSAFAANCEKDVKLIFNEGEEKCLSEFPNFFKFYDLKNKRIDLDYFKSKKIISFAGTNKECGYGWGISHSYISPIVNDIEAINFCKQKNKKNSCNCDIILSSDAPIGALKVKIPRNDFIERFQDIEISTNGVNDSKEISNISAEIIQTSITENQLNNFKNYKFITNIPKENEIEVIANENRIWQIKTISGRNFYLVGGILQIIEKSSDYAKLVIESVNKIYPYQVGKKTSFKITRKKDSWNNTIIVDSIISIDTPIGQREVFKIIHEEKGIGNNLFHERYELYVDKKLDILWMQDVKEISGTSSGRAPFRVVNIIPKSNSISNFELVEKNVPSSNSLTLAITSTEPDANGEFLLSIQTSADTASLQIDGEEQGGKKDGKYSIRRVARVGEQNVYTISARDIYGNTDTKTIAVARQVADSRPVPLRLNPLNIKVQQPRDAVAIIIGIEKYKRVPKAEFANLDAKDFYNYAVRGLGIRPENIKLLLDEEADDIEIVKAFENWLPLQVKKDKTDVYVFYSGHGLPSTDGQSLYFLPHGVDKQYLARTAVGQKEVVAALVASKPKSVTMFIDSCYSGQTRGGDVLVASVKPIALKAETNSFPSNFTVITASTNDQLSSSSPELKHGIFSFFLMKGMEGDADSNKDGKITTGEMQEYLSDKVSRQALSMSRKQDTQLIGDSNRVLLSVGK